MTRPAEAAHPPAVPPAPQSPATLQDCDREPIHMPGHIQPHGALLVFDAQAMLTAWSANANDVLGLPPLHLGQALDQLTLPAAVAQAVRQCISEAVEGEAAAQLLEACLGGRDVDVVVHGHAGRFLLEFERREQSADAIARFALHAHRAIERLKRQRSHQALLQVAVDELRTMTGFDRVMAYVFRHDDSGDVVAEARRADLEAWVGRRYPASDIPAQARRMYTLNTLRLIANARYVPVPVLASADDTPLDMTHSVLRSVSPIHLEYLANMGVAASMSVSIVVQGRLWGMLACHHQQPHLVPYAVRMACDVLAQVLAVTVQGMLAREQADMARSGAALHTALTEAVLHDDDMLQALAGHAEPLAAWLGAEGLGFVQGGRVLQHGPLPEALLRATAAALQGSPDDMVLRHTLAQWPEAPAPSPGPWVGLLALRVDPATELWLLAWRREQLETVRWGGRPEKPVQQGPSGARLTPRGSFDEWRETVRGAAVPWEAARLEAAKALMAALHRAGHARHAELERARTQMLAVLGHDLRDPLHSIAMAAHVLQHDDGAAQGLGRRIGASSGRMQRLVSQVLDLSRLRSGLGLGLKPRTIDMAPLLDDLADEARVANPGISLQLEQPPQLLLQVDPDRMAQALGNLLGNALHHGRPGEPVRIRMAVDGGQVRLEVRNVAPPIPDTLLGRLFSPFKRAAPAASDGVSHHAGLGLGLYIAHEIVTGHGGRLDYRFDAPEVVFTIHLPLSMVAASGDASAAAGAPAAPVQPRPAAATSSLAVLVVDDHVDNAEVMAEVLAMEGHQAQAATSPEAALRMAQAKPWDVIVLDVQMPGLDGVALAQRLHTLLQPPPRLLALTGRSIAELGDSAAVFETVLRKPVDIEQFLRIVRRG